MLTLRLSRREVFWRDGYAFSENMVSACIPCNHRKAGRIPKEPGMALLKEPRVPWANTHNLFARQPLLEEWKRFIPWVVASPRRAP